jgi:hypothetical protein
MPLALSLSTTGHKELQNMLSTAHAKIKSPRRVNEYIAIAMHDGGKDPAGREHLGIKRHITEASKTRHKTATRLGAKPTQYLAKAAGYLTTSATNETATVTITKSSEIFSRTNGPVTVRPTGKLKWIAIPAHKDTCGKWPRNFPEDSMDFVVIKEGKLAALFEKKPNLNEPDPVDPDAPEKPKRAAKARTARKADKPKNLKRKVMFWLVKSATLPHDRGLLPTDKEFYELVFLGIDNALVQSGAKL